MSDLQLEEGSTNPVEHHAHFHQHDHDNMEQSFDLPPSLQSNLSCVLQETLMGVWAQAERANERVRERRRERSEGETGPSRKRLLQTSGQTKTSDLNTLLPPPEGA